MASNPCESPTKGNGLAIVWWVLRNNPAACVILDRFDVVEYAEDLDGELFLDSPVSCDD
jgi:hypothetical protein